MIEALLERGSFSFDEEQEKHDVLISRDGIIDRYLDYLPFPDMINAVRVRNQIEDPEKPITSTVVIIPVAAHQEAPQIANAIDQYAQQETDEPFTLVLGLNTPRSEAHSEATKATLAEVAKAKAKHPHLDIRTSFMKYKKPKIGQIRRDLWNGVLKASNHIFEGFENNQDVIGINNDIDLIYMDKTYISQVQAEYRKIAEQNPNWLFMPTCGTNVVHDTSPQHPNISSVIEWSNMLYSSLGAPFEASAVIPMTYYALYGGIKKAATHGEIVSLVCSHYTYTPSIPHTHALTSPRRYLAYADEFGHDIWQGTFKATDICRTDRQTPDISSTRKDEIIRSSIIDSAPKILGEISLQIYDDYFRADPSYDDEDRILDFAIQEAHRRFPYARDRLKDLLALISENDKLKAEADESFSLSRGFEKLAEIYSDPLIRQLSAERNKIRTRS